MRVAAVAAAAAPCRSAKAGAQRVMAATAPQRAWGASHAAVPRQPQDPQQPHAAGVQQAAAAAARPPPLAVRGRRRLPPARVTNERREILDPVAGEDKYIVVDPENPIPNPQLGPLERRIGLPYEEALFTDDVDAEAQEYWFTEPKTGWNHEKRRLRKLEEAEHGDEEDSFRYTGAAAAGRTPLSAVREGAVLSGTVTANYFYHGAQVDIGAEYDGLLPLQEEAWEDVGVALAPGTQVQVRVHRVREGPLFRFPIQLVLLDPALGELLPAPEEHQPPMDLRVLTMRPEEIAARSEGARTWTPETVFLQLESEFEYASGGDLAVVHDTPLELSAEQQAAMDAAAERLASSF
ncbi:Nucleic acid-OB-fold [Micractinium conductrix]|uniref:Nucleic acid-OB-fold n=1 Tax=Micractinium conductrix TaxID=554055 RepID=A0A2P6VH67_9CHLO|nr:Nucleic acid-OB-fold [Micractinium conductrix]|eukprot:PSC73436.1 Nucleic acid-OB-fold [Micractinium conductrix]